MEGIFPLKGGYIPFFHFAANSNARVTYIRGLDGVGKNNCHLFYFFKKTTKGFLFFGENILQSLCLQGFAVLYFF